MARLARYASHHAIVAFLVLHGVVTLRAHVVSLDRLHAKLFGDFLRSRFAMQRVKGCKMRRPHPLMYLGLMALRTLLRSDYLRGVWHRRAHFRLFSIYIRRDEKKS